MADQLIDLVCPHCGGELDVTVPADDPDDPFGDSPTIECRADGAVWNYDGRAISGPRKES